ncbi:MAG: hypothetical protein LQ351_002513 [Letrouitia transgressa]|nr:MAG: hypothetical protein LQ351_002513 [Letrouitia transgressa]
MAQTLPSPSDIQYQLSHVDDNRQPELIAAYTICGTLAVVSVGSRFLSRRLNTSGIEADDYAALVGMICALGYIVGQAVAIKHGLGRHRILSTAPIQSGKAVLVSIIMYLASMAATKISILLLYRRIFPIWKLRCIGWAVGIFIFAYSFAAVFAVIFACHPVEGVWNPLVSAKCNNTNATVLVMAIFNVVTDVIVLVLPMPVIWELQLPKTRKFQVMAVFLLGSLYEHSFAEQDSPVNLLNLVRR